MYAWSTLKVRYQAVRSYLVYTPNITKSTYISSMRTILFPTDFSDSAENAFVYALHFAHHLQAGLYALHAYQLPSLHSGSLPLKVREAYETLDTAQLDDFKEELPGLKAIAEAQCIPMPEMKHLIVKGEPTDVILQTIQQEKPMLVVMGTTGAGQWKEYLLGSVAGKVLDQCNVPVLVVPDEAHFDGQFNEFLAFSELHDSEQHLIELLSSIARPYKAHVTVYVAGHDSLTPSWALRYKNMEHLHFVFHPDLDLKGLLEEALPDRQPDVVAVLNHRQKWWTELLKNDPNRAILAKGIPVLSITYSS